MSSKKQQIRLKVWEKMEQLKIGRFPLPLINRIPNFKGAEQAAYHLRQLDVYKQAKTIKVNPDAPQLPLRTQILIDGKTLLVPTPRLRAGFIQVKPKWVPSGQERKAASLRHIHHYGREIALTDIPHIDLIVVGSVAVNRDGRRLGKGEGYADREYAILRELGHPPIPVATTVHSIQVVDEDIPIDSYDLTVDFIVTEKGVIITDSPYPKPEGIDWDLVTEEEKEAMPVLEEVYQWRQNHQP